MSKEINDVDRLEQVYHKLDDFQWLIKCIATCHFDEFEADQFSAAMNCFSRLVKEAKEDIASVLKITYPDDIQN